MPAQGPEDALIDALRDLVENDSVNRRIRSRIGDDAAVWQPSRSARSVITTDALIENVHFRRATMPLYAIGWRAMAANLSDLAAMGARPLLATVAAGLPTGIAREDLLELYRGMLAIASRHGCTIAGGDLTAASELMLSITAVGEARPTHVKGRAGAQPGDVIAVTGPLGASRAGLHALEDPQLLEGELRAAAIAAHNTPLPLVREGRWLAAGSYVHALMDISDGLSIDVARMCRRSSCGAAIDHVPVAESAVRAAIKRGEEPAAYALAGGEDYELLAAVAPRAFRYLSARFARRFGRPLHAAGRFTKGERLVRLVDGREEPLESTGFDHFRSSARL